MRWVWHARAREQTGASTLEYVAVVVLATVVVGAILAWGLPTLPQQVASGVGSAVCTIFNQEDCEPAEPGEATSGEGTGADGDGADPGDSDSAAEEPGGGTGGGENNESGGDQNPGENGAGNGEAGDENTDPPSDTEPDGDTDGSETGDTELVDFNPELAEELEAAQNELTEAEEALAEAEAEADALLDDLLELLWEITGGADIERCFTEGDIGSCIMAAIGALPWGKLLKVASKIPKMWRMFDRWRDLRRGRNARRADVDSANTRYDEALEACGIPSSFVPGTPVLLADGTYRAIEDVAPGDEVLAFDPLTGAEGPREVTASLESAGEKTLVSITVTDQDGAADTLVATDNHPFWAPELAQWVDAVDLTPGTWLRTSSGTWIRVSAVHAWTVADQQVHNLTVAGIRTYYVGVGSAETLVHNQAGACGNTVPPRKPADPQRLQQDLRNYESHYVNLGDQSVMISRERMGHFLERHHPDYWNGTTRQNQTFFSPDMSIRDVERTADAVVRQNASTIRGQGTASRIAVDGTVDGVNYHLVIDNGRIVQFYPHPIS